MSALVPENCEEMILEIKAGIMSWIDGNVTTLLSNPKNHLLEFPKWKAILELTNDVIMQRELCAHGYEIKVNVYKTNQAAVDNVMTDNAAQLINEQKNVEKWSDFEINPAWSHLSKYTLDFEIKSFHNGLFTQEFSANSRQHFNTFSRTIILFFLISG